MLPRPMPEMSASVTSTASLPGPTRHCEERSDEAIQGPRALPWIASSPFGLLAMTFPGEVKLLRRHRHDVVAVVAHHDVIVLVQRVVVLGRERLRVGLDQAVVAVDRFERLAHLVAVGRAG